MALRVYRIPFSTNVERVALAAGHKGLEIEWVDVDPLDRSPVEAVSGQSLVPVLVDGDEVVTDSPAIVALLEERFPEPPLYPADAARRAEVEIFVDWFNRVWKRPPNAIADELEQAEPDFARVAELSAEMRARSTASRRCSPGATTSSASSASPTASRSRSSSTPSSGCPRTTTSSSTASSSTTCRSATATRA